MKYNALLAAAKKEPESFEMRVIGFILTVIVVAPLVVASFIVATS